jgi:hypothetical protein
MSSLGSVVSVAFELAIVSESFSLMSPGI